MIQVNENNKEYSFYFKNDLDAGFQPKNDDVFVGYTEDVAKHIYTFRPTNVNVLIDYISPYAPQRQIASQIDWRVHERINATCQIFDPVTSYRVALSKGVAANYIPSAQLVTLYELSNIECDILKIENYIPALDEKKYDVFREKQSYKSYQKGIQIMSKMQQDKSS